MRGRIANALAMSLLVAGIHAGAGEESIGLKSDHAQSALAKRNQLSAPSSRTHYGKAVQFGLASWYGEHYHGRRTAGGELFDMYDFTAAHPTLPFGTHVRVTNLHNGKAVIVRINDRGPLVKGRIIDLSYSAASVLDFKGEGLIRVRLDF